MSPNKVKWRSGWKHVHHNALEVCVVLPKMMRNEEWTAESLVRVARVLRRDMIRQSQANRASVRRSRLRRQAQNECAGCSEVHARLHSLRIENQLLRECLKQLYDEWDKIAYTNTLMKGELSKLAGQEKLPELDVFLRSRFNEG